MGCGDFLYFLPLPQEQGSFRSVTMSPPKLPASHPPSNRIQHPSSACRPAALKFHQRQASRHGLRAMARFASGRGVRRPISSASQGAIIQCLPPSGHKKPGSPKIIPGIGGGSATMRKPLAGGTALFAIWEQSGSFLTTGLMPMSAWNRESRREQPCLCL